MNDHTRQNHDVGRERQTYTPPTLRAFGPVGKLTKGGAGTRGEGGTGMAMGAMN